MKQSIHAADNPIIFIPRTSWQVLCMHILNYKQLDILEVVTTFNWRLDKSRYDACNDRTDR